MNIKLNFGELLDALNEEHGGAGFTFCTREEQKQLISLAVEEGKVGYLPQSWIDEYEL